MITENTQDLSGLGLKWSGMTHNGRVRKNNEDAFLALTFDSQRVEYLGKDGEADFDLGNYVFAVSDGMGGANAGEFASKIAVEMITNLMPETYNLASVKLLDRAQDYFIQIFTKINNEMIKMSRSYEECRGMGATLSMCWITPEISCFAHIGDSRIYHIPVEGGINQLSHDHTQAGWLMRNGKITASEVRRHPNRSQLQQVLGGVNSNIDPQFNTVSIKKGDYLVLCTDGIWDDVSENNIEFKTRTPIPSDAEKTASKRLVDEAFFNSGEDNLTALVIEVV